MVRFDNLDLIVSDVPAATAFFRDVVGVGVRVEGDRYAELDSGEVTIMLSPDALVPVEPARGVILHFQTDDIAAVLARALESGAPVVLEPTATDWGTESAMVRGPDGIIVEIYRWLEE